MVSQGSLRAGSGVIWGWLRVYVMWFSLVRDLNLGLV